MQGGFHFAAQKSLPLPWTFCRQDIVAAYKFNPLVSRVKKIKSANYSFKLTFASLISKETWSLGTNGLNLEQKLVHGHDHGHDQTALDRLLHTDQFKGMN